jgi:hypothetical protein
VRAAQHIPPSRYLDDALCHSLWTKVALTEITEGLLIDAYHLNGLQFEFEQLSLLKPDEMSTSAISLADLLPFTDQSIWAPRGHQLGTRQHLLVEYLYLIQLLLLHVEN